MGDASYVTFAEKLGRPKLSLALPKVPPKENVLKLSSHPSDQHRNETS